MAKKVKNGILVLREFTRPAGWIMPDDPPFEYEKRMYPNPDLYLQYLANHQCGYDKFDRPLIEDHRTEKQYQHSRKRIGPWVWGGMTRG